MKNDLRTFTPDHRHLTLQGEIQIPLTYTSRGETRRLPVYIPDDETRLTLEDNRAVMANATVRVKDLLALLEPSNNSVLMDHIENYLGIRLVDTIRYPDTEGSCRNAGRLTLNRLNLLLEDLIRFRPGRASAHQPQSAELKRVLDTALAAGIKASLEAALKDSAVIPKSREEVLLANLEASVKSLEDTFQEHTELLKSIAVMMGLEEG